MQLDVVVTLSSAEISDLLDGETPVLAGSGVPRSDVVV